MNAGSMNPPKGPKMGDKTSRSKKTVTMSSGFGLSHPRQRQTQRRRRNTTKRGTRRIHQPIPTQELTAALKKLETYIPSTSMAQDAYENVLMAAEALEISLSPPETLVANHKLVVSEPTPKHLVQPFPEHELRIARATYEANDPSEDRSTVVIGEDFLFAGVWDGHGGYQCSEFTQNTIFEAFADAFEETKGNIPLSFDKAYTKTNREYYHYVRGQNPDHQAAYFAGTCAVACFIDLTQQKFWCGNLGDSRAVMGVFRHDGELHTQLLSVDHTAANLIERQRIQAVHPDDPEVVLDMTQFYSDSDDSYEEPPDWRVKKLAAFTRSIGDLQLKEKNTSALFNSYMSEDSRIYPRPGIVAKGSYKKTPPYISTDVEVKEFAIKDSGFLIIACDGVWDEMESEEAVECVANLLSDHSDTNCNVAELFIEEVLKKAVQRLRENDDYEADLTLEEMKARPKGKATDGARSMLHDDITVVIVQLGSMETYHKAKVRRNRHSSSSRKSMRSSSRSADSLLSIEELRKLQSEDPDRSAKDKQIVAIMEYFEGMNTRHMEVLFNALDMDGNGSLDRQEVGRLMDQIMMTKVSEDIVDVAFQEMDRDHSGTVDFTEFVAYFGHNRK